MSDKRTLALYRSLMHVLPRDFRQRNGADMEAMFTATINDPNTRAERLGTVKAWISAIRDVVSSATLTRWRRLFGYSTRGQGPRRDRYRTRGWLSGVLDQLFSEVRVTVRSLAAAPGFTLTATVTIGLGMGATTLIFSVVHGVLLRPLPYADSHRLVNVWNDLVEERQFLPAVHAADFRDYQQMSKTLEEFAAASRSGQVGLQGVLTGDGPPRSVDVSPVTHNFFSMLGVEPLLGRHFTEEEEQFSGPQVAMLSHRLWQQRWGGDPAVVGSTIQLDGRAFTVVGVLPRSFRLLLPNEAFLIKDSEIWVPLQTDYNRLPPRDWTAYTVLGKLAPGVSLQEAQSEMDAVAATLRATHPEHATSGMQIRLVPFHGDIVKQARPALLTLLGAVGFVLLIACANVAHLLLLRGTARQPEFAVRAALGARRSVLARQALLESLGLGALGALVGLGITYVGLATLTRLQPPNLPRLDDIAINGAVLAFTAAAAVLTAVIFGIAPAYLASRTDLTATLKDGARAGTSATASRLRTSLVGAEIALSLVLLVGAGLMIRSFEAFQQIRPGFDHEHVMTFGLALPRTDYPDGEAITAFYRSLTERIGALRGVETVGGTTQLPLTGSGPLLPYAYDDETALHFNLSADGRSVVPGYFESMGIQLLAGRVFDSQDRADGEPTVIVEQMLAERAWPGEDPIGKQLQTTRLGNNRTVVGVVEHTRIYTLTADLREHMYFPPDQRASRTMRITVRSELAPESLSPMLREQVWALDPDLPIDDMRPLSDYVLDARAEARFMLVLLSAFGALALTLAAVGVYGVVSYAVDQRRHEFGVRIALGASPQRLVRSVLASGAGVVVVSIAIGVLAATALAPRVSSLLYGVSPTDSATYGTAAAVLALVGLAACYLPARRTARADPVKALQAE